MICRNAEKGKAALEEIRRESGSSHCCDPIAVEIDPFCKYIGGKIHAATITPSGFNWVQGYEPVQ
jgi:hypothetical protein